MTTNIEFKDFASYESVWHRNGRTPDGEKITISDALSVTNAPSLFPKVVSNIVKEAMEPLLIGTSLLTRINYSGMGQTISFGAVGAMEASDINEGMEYPEKSLAMGGGTVTANIGKSGVAVKITEEMLRYSQFDVLGMHLRAAGKALGRLKEQKIFAMIRKMGVTAFDNVTPTKSLKGVMSGRALDGSQNGSMTMDDVFDCYAQVMAQGFMPNTLLMHPLTWVMFIKDPVLRAFALANGGGTMFANWTGNPSSRAPWDNNGGLGMSGGQNIVQGPSGNASGNAASGAAASPALAFPQDLNSAPVLPSYFNVPMRIVVSPYVNYDAASKTSDIYMFDSNELGALIVDEEVTMEEFADPARDMKKIKLRERYGLAIFNEGQGIATMKNVHIVPNEVVLPAQAHLDVSSSALAKFNPTASVLS
jgi:hypothetical protein